MAGPVVGVTVPSLVGTLGRMYHRAIVRLILTTLNLANVARLQMLLLLIFKCFGKVHR